MRFSLPAIALGAATSLIIAAILVFLRDVEVLQNSIIPLGMILIGLLFSFIAIPMYERAKTMFRYLYYTKPSDPNSVAIRLTNPTFIILLGLIVLALYAMIYLFGEGNVYSTNVDSQFAAQDTGGSLLFLLNLVGFGMFMGMLLFGVIVIEIMLKEGKTWGYVVYFLQLGPIFMLLVLGTPPVILYTYFSRTIRGYLLLRRSQKRLNILRDFFIPLFVVLIPLTAYLSGVGVR